MLLYNVKGFAKGRDHYQCMEKAELVREGSDCVIFTYSRMRYVVMQVTASGVVCVMLFRRLHVFYLSQGVKPLQCRAAKEPR